MESQSAKKPEHLIGVVLEDGERHDFDTEDEFDRFIADTEHHEQVREARKAAKGAKRPTDADVQELKTKTGKIDSELKKLAQELRREPYSREVFEKATIERDPGQPAIFDATMLFDQAGFAGAAAPVYRDVYNLSFIGWNGPVSSLLSDRSLILYSLPGFGGSQYWIFARLGGLATVADLGWFRGLAASLRYQA